MHWTISPLIRYYEHYECSKHYTQYMAFFFSATAQEKEVPDLTDSD